MKYEQEFTVWISIDGINQDTGNPETWCEAVQIGRNFNTEEEARDFRAELVGNVEDI